MFTLRLCAKRIFNIRILLSSFTLGGIKKEQQIRASFKKQKNTGMLVGSAPIVKVGDDQLVKLLVDDGPSMVLEKMMNASTRIFQFQELLHVQEWSACKPEYLE